MQDNGRWEFIYDQINGLNEPDVCEWVTDEFSMEGALGPLVERIYEARSRLRERPGLAPDTNPDFELLIRGLEDLSRACRRLMYRYGYQDGARQNERE